MNKLRGVRRLVVFMFVTMYYVAKIILSAAIKGVDNNRAIRQRHQWGLKSLKVLGVEIDLKGAPPEGSHLYLCNHRTYLDGAIMVKYVLGTFVIKSEVGKWPVIGLGARACRAIMVKREDKESRIDTRRQMREAMEKGISVVIFPEGTTSTGPGVLPLKSGPFRIAQDGGFTVVPVAFEYENVNDAWVGNDTFVRHFIECFGKKKTHVKVSFGEVLAVTDWENDLIKVQGWLQQETLSLRAEYTVQEVGYYDWFLPRKAAQLAVALKVIANHIAVEGK